MDITKVSTFMDDFLISKDKAFERIGIVSVDVILDISREIQSVPQSQRKVLQIEAFGYLIGIRNLKMRTFLTHGTKCVSCGRVGDFFAVEKQVDDSSQVILNLYLIDENGQEVLMNMDHRLPRAKGGADCIENMQTMCRPCNRAKGCQHLFSDGGVSKEELQIETLQKQQANAKKRTEFGKKQKILVSNERSFTYNDPSFNLMENNK